MQPAPTFQTYWVVWCPTASQPTRKHKTEEDARKEAERLAKLNPNSTFAVLQSLGEVVQPFAPLAWTRHTTDYPAPEDIPF